MKNISGYWDQNVSNWKVANHLQIGTQAFFEEVERYRFEKLDYLPAAAGFDRYSGRKVLDLPSNEFDFVYCHTVLHFTPSPGKMVREIHRVLKPGGTALLMAINRRSWLYFLHRIAGVKIDYMDAPVFHKMDLRRFTELTAPFPDKEIKLSRLPKRTEVHKGWKAAVYNTLFVDLFHAFPARMTRNTGYHMLAFVRKTDNVG